jgi:PII-like signaling protein
MIPEKAGRLSLYLNASDRWQGKPLYRAIVEKARSMQIAGASVFLVDLSYGANRRIRDAKSEYSSVDIPVVVEIVDVHNRVEALLAELGAIVAEGLIAAEPVRVLHYEHHTDRAEPGSAPRAAAASLENEPPSDPFALERTTSMQIEGDAQRVTVYIGSSDTWHGRNLSAAIVERCRKMGMAGATASLGVMGFGKHSVIHRAHLFGLSEDLPEKIEIIDHPDRIAQLLPVLEEMVKGGLIVLQDVRAIRYQHHPTPRS